MAGASSGGLRERSRCVCPRPFAARAAPDRELYESSVLPPVGTRTARHLESSARHRQRDRRSAHRACVARETEERAVDPRVREYGALAPAELELSLLRQSRQA